MFGPCSRTFAHTQHQCSCKCTNVRVKMMMTAFASRYRPPTFHVQAWYDEVKDFSFSYPQECNPYCPFKCSGPVCTHYTQVIVVFYHLITSRGGAYVISLRLPVAAGLGHKQSDRLRRQLVLQHECVGPDLGQSGLSCLQLFTKVRCWAKPHSAQHKVQPTLLEDAIM